MEERKMLSMVDYVHERIQSYPKDLIGVYFTMGNGHDTVFLADYCSYVYAFDIQKEALEKTKQLLKEKNNVQLILDGHQNMDQYITSFDIGIFNLGYLPLADHHVTTLLKTTQMAIKKALASVQQVLFIVVYPGHEEGYKESLWIDDYVCQLDSHQWNVSSYKMLNKNQAPYVIEIQKKSV